VIQIPAGYEVTATLAITGGALLLFLWNRFRMDVVGVLVMVTLIVTGLVSPQQGISGFANEAMVTVAAMFVLSAGLARTGVIDVIGRWMARRAGKSEIRLLVVLIAVIIPVSAFINNTPVVIVMLPVILGIARDIDATPSKLLMPASFASQMGGTLTLIGTSTNLLVAGLVLELGLDRIGIFDITPPALVLMVVGVAYLLTVGRWLTPEREGSRDLLASEEIREYLTALEVVPGGSLPGRTLGDVRFEQTYGLQVTGVERADGERIRGPGPATALQPGDVLLARGPVPDIAGVEETGDLRVSGARSSSALRGGAEEAEEEDPEPGEGNGGEEKVRLAELIVTPRSHHAGRTLQDIRFRGRYGASVLALQRHGELSNEALGELPLAPGDILLVQGSARSLRTIHERGDFALLGAVDVPAKRLGKRILAVAIMVAVVLLAFLEVTTILVSALMGVAAMFITGCLTPEEAYEEVDWMVLVLLGSIIPLGIAMQQTGTAELLATGLLGVTAPLGLLGTLAAFYLLASVLTELISNNASAVVLTPLAVATGLALDVSPLPFVIAVMLAASNSFMTPVGYQTNTFIYGPGGYRFSDFLRVGAPLNLLLLVTATFVIPLFFPF
jgi:di/tricarboxylate transporter